MNIFRSTTVAAAFLCLSSIVSPADVFARGGRGGAGGGVRMSAPRPAGVSRSPSLSRVAAPTQAVRTTPRTAVSPRTAVPGSAPGVGSKSAYSRPSAGQVNSFLNLPSNVQSRTYTTERGTTITVAGKGGGTTTGSGAKVGAGAGAVKVETAGGSTYGKAGAAVAGTGAGGSAAAGRSVSGYRGAGGVEGAKISGGAASSSGYRQGGSVSAIQGRQGYTAVNVRGGYGAGGTGRVGSASAIVGPGGNVISAGRGGAFVNGQFVGGQAWRGVNGAFNHWNWYGPGWYGRYPGAWFPGKWALATTAWATAAWALAGPYCGCDSGSPAYYDYGENVTYGDDGTVYSDGQPVASSAEYYDQATQIAATGESPQNEEWLPLGIFAVVSEGQTQTDKTVQLALNKEGMIRGNYHDLLADKVIPVTGAVDKETQRVALKIEGNDDLVVETGLYNLTNDEAPVLVHFGPDRQEQRTFIRLQQPEAEGPAPEEAAE